ncbi:MAG: phage holin family protein [Gemmatimonadaceae bacterium]|nr:phage holin family protein [Gemmatimonadaceae bacterium]
MPAPSISAVLRDIGDNVDRIARSELRLVVAGLRSRIREYGEVSVYFAAAAVAATVAGLFVLLGAMFALAKVLPLWLAALVIAAILVAAAAALYYHGRAQLPETRPPAPKDLVPAPRGDA